MTIAEQLRRKIEQQSTIEPSSAVSHFVEALLTRYGDAVQAILFYGSCLHRKEDLDGLFDLYIVVDDYMSANRNSFHASLNSLLPPNVFYLEVPFNQQTIRAKYAVLSREDLAKSTSPKWFHSYIWARFCQPTLIAYSRSDEITTEVTQSFAQAVMTFINRSLPRMQQEFTIRDLWSKGLELTYRSELRPEKADKQVRLFDSDPHYFEIITSKAFLYTQYKVQPCSGLESQRFCTEIPKITRIVSYSAWTIRIVQGKILSLLRLIKGTLTFEGGVDYILWKVHRHTGVTMEVSPFLRRHPLLAMLTLSWRLYKRGGVK